MNQGKLSKIKKIKLISDCLPVIGIATVFFSALIYMEYESDYIIIIGFSLFFILLVMSIMIKLVYWRCPKCKRVLPISKIFIDYCPYCGEKID